MSRDGQLVIGRGKRRRKKREEKRRDTKEEERRDGQGEGKGGERLSHKIGHDLALYRTLFVAHIQDPNPQHVITVCKSLMSPPKDTVP